VSALFAPEAAQGVRIVIDLFIKVADLDDRWSYVRSAGPGDRLYIRSPYGDAGWLDDEQCVRSILWSMLQEMRARGVELKVYERGIAEHPPKRGTRTKLHPPE
jgi:hypothetical protein